MGKIFCLMGKSSSGKDTIARKILGSDLNLKSVLLFTTRPIRTGEVDGRDYFFVTDDELKKLESSGKVIEKRVYNTVHGPWTYATVDENNAFDLENNNYLILNTLEGYKQLASYFGDETIVPIYIWVPFEVRLDRAFMREEQQENPKYKELCRRFVMDENDFSEEKLSDAGISYVNRYLNYDLEQCFEMIKSNIVSNIEKNKIKIRK